VRTSLELVRNVIERRAELRTDARHGANRRNGDEGGDQAVFNGGRALFAFNQLEKLAHGLAPWFQGAESPNSQSTFAR